MNFLLLSFVCALAYGVTRAQSPPSTMCHGYAAGIILPDYTDCSRFYRCPGGTGQPARGTCNPGRFFDPPTGECLLPEQANCFRCPADQPFVELAVPRTCNQFIRCIDNQAQHLECASGLLFDQSLDTCNLAALTSCTDISCPANDDPNSRMWFRDPANCAVFFVCIRGWAVRSECPPGLQFNTITHQCDFQQTVQCRPL